MDYSLSSDLIGQRDVWNLHNVILLDPTFFRPRTR